MTNDDVKILVVDDDPDILFSTTRVIKNGGYDTIAAETGMQALEIAKNDHPDLILLDV